MDFIEACSNQVPALVWCLLDKLSVLQINTRSGIYEWGGGESASPTVWQIPRQRSSPFRPPLPFLVCRTCLFLEVPTLVPAHCLGWKSERKQTQGVLREADFYFLTDAGDRVSPSQPPSPVGRRC